MANIQYHYNRRPRNFLHRKVRDALPEFFTQDYPKLVTFLEKYYDFLDSDGASSFDNRLRKIYQTRDTQETTSDLLKFIIEEIAAGNTGGNFVDPSFYAQRIHELHRTKGSRFSIEEFFRAFFQQNVEVEYPKKDIFTVGSSKIGTESLKFIQNAALYQVFSVLIKTAISAPTWEELYKKFMHPAGFFIGARITSDAEASLSGTAQGFINDFDSGAVPVLSEASTTVFAPFAQMTQLIDSNNDGTADYRIGLDQLISVYQTFTPTQLDKFYSNFGEITTPNSFKFDDSDKGDSAGAARPDFSLTTETMDNEMFSNYLADSTF